MSVESLSLGCSYCPEGLRRILGRFFHFFSFYPAEPRAQCRVRVRVKRRYLRRRAVAFSSLFNSALPKPSSAQSRGATRVPCSRVTWYRAMYGSVCYLISFVCCICSTLFFSTKHFPARGAVGVATFHPGYLSFPRLTPRLADGPQEVFRKTSPLCQRLCSPLYRRGLASP